MNKWSIFVLMFLISEVDCYGKGPKRLSVKYVLSDIFEFLKEAEYETYRYLKKCRDMANMCGLICGNLGQNCVIYCI
ncbi:hypothetical protein SNE40_008124 [Patella caerulea]|uniref:Uncharacterized protein n=1 Tax=Patella caerulea TaxID=87958 RepID=A0AAN8K189_PATCE